MTLKVFTRGAYPPDLLIAAELAAAANEMQPEKLSFVMQAIEDCAVYGSEIVTPIDASSYVLVSANYLICVFQCTTDWRQWVGHVLGSEQRPVANVPGRVDGYFGLIAENSYLNIKNVLDTNIAGKQVVCIGHSLGGATAQIVAKLIEHDYGIKPKVFCFGTPRVGDTAFAFSFEAGQVWRVEEVGCPVAALPPSVWGGRILPLPWPSPQIAVFYTHAGEGISVSNTGVREKYTPPSNIITVAAWYNGTNPVELHSIDKYIRDLTKSVTEEEVKEDASNLSKPENVFKFLKDQQNETNKNWGIPGFNPFAIDFAPILTFGGGGMATWRATLFFNLPSSGWTETYYMNADNPDVVASKADALAKARIGLCGTGCAIENVRISDEAQRRDYGLYPLAFGSEGDGTDAASHAKAFQSLVVNLINGPYRNRVYLRGIAQGQYLGDKKVNVDSDFNSLFKNWKAVLKRDGWLMRVQKRFEDGVNYNITGATLATPPVITFAAGLAVASGDQVTITGVKGMKSINGTFFCDKLTDTTLSLRGAVPDSTYLGGGVIRKKVLQYLPILDASVIKETSRKAGKNSGQSVGRRKAR